jgi:hypothetical protein
VRKARPGSNVRFPMNKWHRPSPGMAFKQPRQVIRSSIFLRFLPVFFRFTDEWVSVTSLFSSDMKNGNN